MSSYSERNASQKTGQSDQDLVHMTVRLAEATRADTIIYATETGTLASRLDHFSGQVSIIAATTNRETFKTLTQTGLEVIRLPLRAANKYNQVRHIISVALRAGRVALGDLVLCTIGHDVFPEEGYLIVLTDVEPSIENISIVELVKLTDGIRPKVLEAAITVACKIGRVAQRGKRLGAIFMLGDSLKVLEGAKQLILNPFHGHDDSFRRLTNPDIHDALVELAKLDGAFVVRGDGFIQTAGVFLAPAKSEIELPPGLGARHAAAAAVTTRTAATAVVVSATDGNVRAFSDGRMILQIDPHVEGSPITLDN